MVVLLPFLLFAAQGAAPEAEAPHGRRQIFIAPSGEPFRTYGEGPYPVAQWFAGADKNGDGKLDFGEFDADFLRFFETLDVNHDGAIDNGEKLRYENTVAPETMGNSSGGPSQEETNAEWASGFDDDVDLPDVDRPKRPGSERPVGAGRFDLLGLPEPVAAMDMELRGRISRSAAEDAARYRFNQLDTQHRGYLTLDALPQTFAQGHHGGGGGGGGREGGRRKHR